MSDRKPVTHLNYRGDLTATFDTDIAYGPNTLGELLYPVTVEYDAEVDQTRVGFSFIAPAGGAA
jgi:hypothetical protein